MVPWCRLRLTATATAGCRMPFLRAGARSARLRPVSCLSHCCNISGRQMRCCTCTKRCADVARGVIKQRAKLSSRGTFCGYRDKSVYNELRLRFLKCAAPRLHTCKLSARGSKLYAQLVNIN